MEIRTSQRGRRVHAVSTAVLSIGSNLGDRAANLATARAHLSRWLTAESPVYETPPWGPVAQDHYLNQILLVADPAAAPDDWLARAHAAEHAAGRTRDVRWGPRTLDVDVVDVVDDDGDAVRSDDPALTLPHPRAAERAFVLVPWLAVDAAASLAGRPVADLLGALPTDEVAQVRRIEAR